MHKTITLTQRNYVESAVFSPFALRQIIFLVSKDMRISTYLTRLVRCDDEVLPASTESGDSNHGTN